MKTATELAQKIADQELQACCEWVDYQYPVFGPGGPLRAARRPEPPSLKEQALATLQKLSASCYPCDMQQSEDWDTIRLALESLDD